MFKRRKEDDNDKDNVKDLSEIFSRSLNVGFSDSKVKITKIAFDDLYDLDCTIELSNPYSTIEINIEAFWTLRDYLDFINHKTDILEYDYGHHSNVFKIYKDYIAVYDAAGKNVFKILTNPNIIDKLVLEIYIACIKNCSKKFYEHCQEGFHMWDEDIIDDELSIMLSEFRTRFNFIPDITQCTDPSFQRQMELQKSLPKLVPKTKRRDDDDDYDDDDY